MTIVALSDMHGQLPEVEPCDVVLIGGDVVPIWAANNKHGDNLTKQAVWLFKVFLPWLNAIPAKTIIMTWGNHDWIGEYRDLWPPFPSHVHCLVDQGIEVRGLKIWASPWQPVFYDWAFNLPEDKLQEKWQLIPTNTDVLVLHGPPQGYGDRVGNKHVGSPSLRNRVLEIEPKLAIFGHIHIHGGKQWTVAGNTGKPIKLANVAVVDEEYKLVRKPVRFDV